MSAQATPFVRVARRLSVLDTVLAAGALAITLVLLGGLGLGFLGWYLALPHLGAAVDASLVVALAIGVALAFAAWVAYGRYFSRRAGIELADALGWDALAWLPIAFCGLATILPVEWGGPSRAVLLAIGLSCLVRVAVAARFVTTVRDVLITFTVTRVSIVVIAELASVTIAQRPGLHVAASTNPLLAVWGRWDAVHYLTIASSGYTGTDMAFFPLYPASIALLGSILGSDLVAGLVISHVALFFGLLYFYKLVEHQFTRAVAHRAIFYISIFPTAIFFSAVYTESLFFALTVASFYYIREHRWLTAGVLGGLAALTRSEGILLGAPYAIEAFAAWRAGPRAAVNAPLWLARVGIGAIAIAAGLGLYMAWLWILNGDPLYFSHVQIHWNRHFAPPWVSLAHAARTIAHAKSSGVVANQAIEIVFTALMIGVLALGARRLRPSFIAYMALSILVPMSTSSLMSMPRFALVLFPMFALMAVWGGRPSINNAIVAFSLPLLGLFTVLFACWYWVA